MTLAEFVETNGLRISKGAGEYLFRQGDEDLFIYFLRSGLLKAYYLSEDGKENVKSFITAGNSIGSLAACYTRQKATFSVICLENSELAAVDFSKLQEEVGSRLDMSNAVIDLLLGFALKKENREYELLCLSAEQRYRRLLERAPHLFQIVTQNDIARYLGVTPVALSRIKQRLRQAELTSSNQRC